MHWGEATPNLLPYLFVAVDISPLLPAASFGSTQPWRGRKPAGSWLGGLGLKPCKKPDLPFLAGPAKMTALERQSLLFRVIDGILVPGDGE